MWLTAFQDRDVTRLKSWGGSILVFGPVLGTSGWINTNVSKKKVKKERGNPQHVKIIWNRQDQYEAGRSMGPFSISSGSKCMQYVYILHTYIYIYIYVNGVAAPKHTGSFLSNLQASPASPLWFLPNEEDEEKGSPCDTRRCWPCQTYPAIPDRPTALVFAMAPKSRHGEPTPQPSLWPLSLVLSKPGKASAGLRSKQGWLHEWISHIYIYT